MEIYGNISTSNDIIILIKFFIDFIKYIVEYDHKEPQCYTGMNYYVQKE